MADKEAEEIRDNEENDEQEDEDNASDAQKDMKPFSKAMLSIITDENFELHDGEELSDDSEKEMSIDINL